MPSLSSAVAPGAGCIVADRRRFGQNLANLASSAVRFTDRGRVSVYVARPEQEVQVAVRDSGICIRESDRAGLFRLFRQVDSGTARRSQGTGLGLVIRR